MQTEQEILQKHLSQFLVSTFNTITPDDILKIKAPNVWAWRGKDLTPGQIQALRNWAKNLIESDGWKILKAELLFLAHQTGYQKSKTEADQISGKLLEYLTDVIDTRLKRMIE